MIVFGDNLQFLKTACENKDPLIKDKVKGKVKLIYIDPPFATESDFKAGQGQSAYSDKKRGADFIEFLLRRLILAKSLLAPDGSIYVHVDFRKEHYIKIVLDELFKEFEFAELIWVCGLMGSGKFYPKAHEAIYCYKGPQKKDGYYAIIYPYWEFKKASVDEEYLEDLHLNIGKKSAADSISLPLQIMWIL